jgi:hypothetical protein
MTPKEKAEELVYDKYFYHPKLYLSKGAAKLCALIAADEVINTIMSVYQPETKAFWFEVKQEIDAL